MIRKRTTLTTTERKQRLFCLLFGSVLLGAALGIVMLRWQYDGVPTSWACFLGMFLEKRSSLAALWLGSIGNILLFLMTFFLLGFSAVGQPFVWLLLLTYGVCMGGTLQMQSALLAVASRESLRFSGKFTDYGFRDEPTDQMCHQLRMYCARFAVLLVLLVLHTLLYSALFYAIEM